MDVLLEHWSSSTHYLFPEVRCLTENGIAGRLDAHEVHYWTLVFDRLVYSTLGLKCSVRTSTSFCENERE